MLWILVGEENNDKLPYKLDERKSCHLNGTLGNDILPDFFFSGGLTTRKYIAGHDARLFP